MQIYDIRRAEQAGNRLAIAYVPSCTPYVECLYLSPELEDINAFMRSCGQHQPIERILATDPVGAHVYISMYLDALAAMDHERTVEDAAATTFHQIGNAFMPLLVPRAVAHAAFLRDPSSLAGAL